MVVIKRLEMIVNKVVFDCLESASEYFEMVCYSISQYHVVVP